MAAAAPAAAAADDGGDTAPGRLPVLQKRAEFVAASRALRWSAPSLNLQARRRDPGETGDPAPRVGYTCSKKVGNAVARNRAKRRLRAAADHVLPRLARPGWDYVLIGKAQATAERPFPALLADLEGALARIHARAAP